MLIVTQVCNLSGVERFIDGVWKSLLYVCENNYFGCICRSVVDV